MPDDIRLLTGDCLHWLRQIKPDSIDCCVTSPPYFGLRDYGMGGQIGLEQTPADFVAKLVEVFSEVRLDPFGGAGTTALVAREHGRKAVLIELNPAYVDIAQRRLYPEMQQAAE